MRVLIKKPRKTIKQRKTARKSFISFWVHWLVEHAPTFVKHRFIKLGRLTGMDPKEVAEIYLKLLSLIRRRALTKNQTALPHKEHWQK